MEQVVDLALLFIISGGLCFGLCACEAVFTVISRFSPSFRNWCEGTEEDENEK